MNNEQDMQSRPLKVGASMAAAFDLFFKNIKTNLFFTLLIFGVPSLALVVVNYFTGGVGASMSDMVANMTALYSDLAEGITPDMDQFSQILGEAQGITAWSIISLALSLFLTPLAYSGVVLAASGRIKNNVYPLSETLSWVLGQYKKVFLAYISAIIMIIGLGLLVMVAFVIVMFILIFATMFLPFVAIPLWIGLFGVFIAVLILVFLMAPMTVAVAVNEDIGGFNAVMRGLKMLMNHVWKHALITFVVTAVFGIVTSIITAILGRAFGTLSFANVAVSAVLGYCVMGASPIVATVLYFGYRREEEYFHPEVIEITFHPEGE